MKLDPDNEEWINYDGQLRRRQRDTGAGALVGIIIAVVLILGLPALLILAANDWDPACLITTCVKVKR